MRVIDVFVSNPGLHCRPLSLKAKRDNELLGPFKDSDPSLKLSFAKEVLKTGAQDETELIWTQLPVRRPQRFWENLRKGFPLSMPLQEVLLLYYGGYV